MSAAPIEREIHKRLGQWKTFSYPKSICLFYAGHIPYAAVYLESGSMYFLNKHRRRIYLEEGVIYFANELLQESRIRNNLYIEKGSKVALIGRSSLLNFAKSCA